MLLPLFHLRRGRSFYFKENRNCMAAIPIWKDKVIDLGGASVEFRITIGGNTIYSGKAMARPGEANAKVRINDVCADYLVNALPTITDRTFTSFALPSFVVQKKSGGTWSTIDTITFYNDWSYDYGFTSDVLSDPINGKVTADMFILHSKKNITASQSATYTKSNGTSTARMITISPTPADGTCVYDAGAVSDTIKVIIGSLTYPVVADCYKYALYYINAYGGWDHLLVEGADLEADSLERHFREQEYDNTNISNRGRVNYVNEVTKSWSLNTGLLTDDQASRMHHLINSPLVYLCEIASSTFIPVVITTNTCEYKTYRNQGNRMFNYQLTIELAQNRIRR